MRSTLWRGDPARCSRPVRALVGVHDRARGIRGPDPRRPRTRSRRPASRRSAICDAAWRCAGVLLSERPARIPRLGTAARARRSRASSRGAARARHGTDRRGARCGRRALREVVARDGWPTQPIWSAFVEAELSGDDGTGTDVASWLRAREAVAAPEAPVLARLLVDYGLARAQVLSGDRGGRGRETIAGLRGAAGRRRRRSARALGGRARLARGRSAGRATAGSRRHGARPPASSRCSSWSRRG